MSTSASHPVLGAVGAVALGLVVGFGPPFPAAAVTAGASPPGAWVWPLAGPPVVARPFQPPVHAWSAGHRGVDLAGPPDAAVLAAGAGVVSFAGDIAGVGVVAIRHANGLRTTYEPVTARVAVGDSVSAGQPVGTLRPGHGDCGPARWCLHWGLLRGSVYLDPLTLVRRGPVRLLPLDEPAAAAALGLPATVALTPASVGRTTSPAASRTAPPAGQAPEGSTGWSGPALPGVVAGSGAVAGLGWWWRQVSRRRSRSRLRLAAQGP